MKQQRIIPCRSPVLSNPPESYDEMQHAIQYIQILVIIKLFTIYLLTLTSHISHGLAYSSLPNPDLDRVVFVLSESFNVLLLIVLLWTFFMSPE